MSRFTLAYSEFASQLAEVEMLRRAAAVRERQNPIALRGEINSLCRGSIVLLSAHTEAYVRRLGELALDSMTAKTVPRTRVAPQLFYHISKDLLGDIKGTEDPEKVAERVFLFLDSDSQLWSRTGPFPRAIPVDRFNQGFASPAIKHVTKYFNRFGYSRYKRDLASLLGREYQPTVNMVNHLVDTRNLIAHGDPSASKTPTEVRDMMRLVRSFCAATDSAFASWWKASFCSIR